MSTSQPQPHNLNLTTSPYWHRTKVYILTCLQSRRWQHHRHQHHHHHQQQAHPSGRLVTVQFITCAKNGEYLVKPDTAVTSLYGQLLFSFNCSAGSLIQYMQCAITYSLIKTHVARKPLVFGNVLLSNLVNSALMSKLNLI